MKRRQREDVEDLTWLFGPTLPLIGPTFFFGPISLWPVWVFGVFRPSVWPVFFCPCCLSMI